ncbi:family 20 glycosylhydrolase [soil metagenome]
MIKFNFALILFILSLYTFPIQAQQKLDSLFPVRALCIAAPKPAGVDEFVKFINEELAPRKVNTLVLRVDYNYQFESHPELRDSVALSKEEVKKLVNASKNHNIRIIPQINLLGHQSWANTTRNLLRVYPEFDETPHVKMPEKYEWPNEDGLYCKSYCPLHPEVHDIVFALVDEITEVFEADAFHAGMDEVFYIGDDKCPRCKGRDKAELFAGEVTKIRNHLARNNRQLWIWGDRLIDGRTTGIGFWEGSYNNTHRAIDMIPRDVMICDWHYERPDQTAVLFAMKGLNVITCPWRRPENALAQVDDMLRFREHSTKEMQERFQGMMQTVWSGAEQFLDGFYGRTTNTEQGENTDYNTFKIMYEKINNLEENTAETNSRSRKKK